MIKKKKLKKFDECTLRPILMSIRNSLSTVKTSPSVSYTSALYGFIVVSIICVDLAISHLFELKDENYDASAPSL